jgi:hypothetical protein
MSAHYPQLDSSFVTANDLPESDDDRTCPFCGKEFDDDARARAFYLRHLADCKDEFEGQATLEAFGASCPETTGATDEQVRRWIEAIEDEDPEL